MRQKRVRDEQKRRQLVSEQTGETNSSNFTKNSATTAGARRASLVRSVSDTSTRKAVREMRHEDPSAYIAIAGLNSSITSERSLDENNLSQRIREEESVEIEFEEGIDVDAPGRKRGNTDRLGISMLGASTASFGLPGVDMLDTLGEDTLTSNRSLEESSYHLDADIATAGISNDAADPSNDGLSSSLRRASSSQKLDDSGRQQQRVTFAAADEIHDEEETKEEEV